MGCCVSTVDPKKEANNKKLPPTINSKSQDKDNSIIRANQYKENEQKQSETYLGVQIKETEISRLSGFQEYKVNFKQKFLTSLNQQEFQEYFLETLLSDNTDISLNTLTYNIDHVNEEYLFGIKTIADAAKKETVKIQDVSLINLSTFKPQSQYLQLKTKSKTFILNTQIWNPILIMISKNQLLPLQVLLLTRTSNFLHLQSLFSKPYLNQNQINVTWSVQKRVQRQIFALKLAIYNKNLNMVQFLINGEPFLLKEQKNKQYLEKINEQDLQQIQDQISQVWNVGHILLVIRQIIKINWIDGLKLLFSLRRVKQLINSVNDANNFLSLLNQFIQLFFSDSLQNNNKRYFPSSLEMKTEFLECLNQDPYKIFKIMINLYLRNLKDFKVRTLNIDETLQIASSLDKEFFPFFQNELNYIFKIFDPQNIFKDDVLSNLQKLCQNENKMKQDMMQLQFNIEDLIQRSKNIKGTKEEFKKIEMILDDLDALNPFQYKDFNFLYDQFEMEEDQKFKNIVTQLLSSGINDIIGHLYSNSSDCNIKSMLIADQTIPFSQTFFRMTKTDFRNTLMVNQCTRATVVHPNLKPDEEYLYESINKYELKETANFNKIDVSFFMILLKKQGIEKFNFAMQHIIEQLDLNAILDLIMIVAQDEDLGVQVQLLLIEQIIQNPKTICLFNNSLELEKLSFVERFINLLGDQEYFDSAYLNKQDEKKLKRIQQDYFKNYREILQKDQTIIDKYKKQTEQWILSLSEGGKQQNNLNQKIVSINNFKYITLLLELYDRYLQKISLDWR